MRFTTTIALGAAFGLTSSRAIPDTHVLHEKRNVPHQNVKRMESNIRLPMRIGLKQNEHAMENGHAWLMDASHPSSEKYGQHWTQKDIISAFEPTEETVKAVADWLILNGGIAKERLTLTGNKAWFAFDATVEEAENLLHTEYYHLENEGRSLVHTNAYHLPGHLQGHVDYITPGVKGTFMDFSKSEKVKRGFGSPGKGKGKPWGWQPPKHHPAPWMPKNNTELETCDVAITPACLQALYGFSAPNTRARVSKSNSLGIFEEGDYYAQEDLNSFFTNFTRYIPNGTHPILNGIDGGYAPVNVSEAGGESDLDFELAIPIIYPQTTTL